MNSTLPSILNYSQLSQDYQTIEQVIHYLELNHKRQPSLDEIASRLGYSAYHFQRLFSRWVGISPKRFMQFLSVEYAKELLDQSESLMAASFEAGLSGPGRLHDLFVNSEAVTPGEYKRRGQGLTINYGIHPSPFGECLIGVTDRGINYLAFVQENDREYMLRSFREQWKYSILKEEQSYTVEYIHKIFPENLYQQPSPLYIYLHGTNFQLKVWEALMRIPVGSVLSYEDLAGRIGHPGAARAVGSALAANLIPFIIPCHRVIQKIGTFGNYRYGSTRKKAMLGWESSRKEQYIPSEN